MTTDFINRAFKNKEKILSSAKCVCYYCCKTFLAKDVVEYCKEKSGGETALCPNCGIDSVIGDSDSILPNEQTLRDWHRKAFGHE